MVRSPKTTAATPAAAAVAKSPVARPSPTAAKTTTTDGPDGKPSGETVLANFFNSLLSKKQTGGKGTGSMRGSRSEARNEAAAELDRMQSKKPGTKS